MLLVGCPDDVHPAGTDTRVDDQQAACAARDVNIAAAVVLVEDVQVSDLRVCIDGDGGVARDDDPQLADVKMIGGDQT